MSCSFASAARVLPLTRRSPFDHDHPSPARSSRRDDSHVFRITKSLGWIPAKADRETAFRHLNVRITKELKYALHSLLVKHGRGCENCSATGKTDARQAFEGNCPIKVRAASVLSPSVV